MKARHPNQKEKMKKTFVKPDDVPVNESVVCGRLFLTTPSVSEYNGMTFDRMIAIYKGSSLVWVHSDFCG